MLDYLGHKEAAGLIEGSVTRFLESGKLGGLSASDVEKSGLGTSGIGDAIAGGIGQVVQERENGSP